MKNELVLCFGYSRWAEWRQDHEIALRLARQNTVIYVESQRPRSEQRMAAGPALRWLSEHLAVLRTPARWPFGGFVPFRAVRCAVAHASILLSKRRLLPALRTALRSVEARPTVSLFFDPFDLPLAGQLGELVSCYRVYDEVALLAPFQPIGPAIDQIERQWLPKIDLIFASSRAQYEHRVKVNRNTHFVPNACDFERYHRSLTHNWPVPADLALIPAPRIGFIGGIDHRIDVELVRFAARSRPDWSILMIGPVKDSGAEGASALRSLPNVHFLGNKRPEKLPGYLRHLNVSIIPYVLNEATATMYPWKVHEHLAAGKPLVATALPELEPLREVVALAASPIEFVKAIDNEIEQDHEERLTARVRTARANCWDERVEQMAGLIDELLQARRRRSGLPAPVPACDPVSRIAAVHCW